MSYDSKISPADFEVRCMAYQGARLVEMARVLGVTYHGIRNYCLRNGIPYASAGAAYRDRSPERTTELDTLYRQGLTLQKIGDMVGLTRERVRQILQRHGTRREDGGGSIVRAAKADRTLQKRNAKAFTRWGMDYNAYVEVRKAGLIGAYRSHENSSKSRGIPFTLTLNSWVSIWRASGKLELRGRGKGRYCMSRIRDDGGYEVGNVHIQLATTNSRDAVEKWRGKTKRHKGVYHLYPGLSKPFLATYGGCGGVRLGFHATAEAAAAARAEYMTKRAA